MRTDRDQRSPTKTIDFLLAEIVIRLQLSRTAYQEADGHCRAIQSWIAREESPLRGRVRTFYPQGSMAIQATVASRLSTDEHDLDIVAELDLHEGVSPEIPLQLLFEAIKGMPGSRYWDMTRRHRRCVTVEYRNMHLDITPSVPRLSRPARESFIFDHPQHSARQDARRIIANPYGFAEWFKSRIRIDRTFADTFAQQLLDYESAIQAQASSESTVPKQEPVEDKSISTIVLQLLKRWRNLKYEPRLGRRPPSVMLSTMVVDAHVTETSLLEALTTCTHHICDRFIAASNQGILIRVTNPVCKADCFTDRWPETVKDQELFLSDLKDLVSQLQKLGKGLPLDQIQTVLTSLFGESPTRGVIEAFNRRSGDRIQGGRSRHDLGAGGFAISGTAVPRQATGRGSRQTPRHTFYGSEDWKRGQTMATKPLSIWKQVKEMRRLHSATFTLLERTRSRAQWEGTLRPLDQAYRLHLSLDVSSQGFIGIGPQVTVLEPHVHRRPEDSRIAIPHIYANDADPDFPFLCLFDPDRGEWGHHRYVAWTTIPWIIDWLVCYEGWLATGRWTGGGRH